MSEHEQRLEVEYNERAEGELQRCHSVRLVVWCFAVYCNELAEEAEERGRWKPGVQGGSLEIALLNFSAASSRDYKRQLRQHAPVHDPSSRFSNFSSQRRLSEVNLEPSHYSTT